MDAHFQELTGDDVDIYFKLFTNDDKSLIYLIITPLDLLDVLYSMTL
jgi:succinate dehydrogenase flavin-adding protein (antitoxin of CptAB toxin-antitoxin module)